ncbi:hypothetical protein ABT186_02055 [Streptomyces sp. NPDC001634]|uniref:hypothetical protein n=1 Tax=Streptomyces sp. NPDC001634 TaxID=3154390 RepID=UPI00332E9E09
MQHHTVQQIDRGPRAGKWIYTGGNDRMGRYAECCSEAWLEMLQTPADERDASPTWERIGHDTADEAYAHMRAVLLDKLRLDTQYMDWAGCRAPVGDGRCDTPTKQGADIRPMYFREPLCDEHRTRETVETMWQGPGDWSGSW